MNKPVIYSFDALLTLMRDPLPVKSVPEFPEQARLLELFEKHKAKLSDLFDNSLTKNNLSWAFPHGVNCTEIEFFGSMFHKAFRQWSPIDNTEDEIEIWKLLQSDGKTNFWFAAGLLFSQPEQPAWPFATPAPFLEGEHFVAKKKRK